MLLNFDRRAKFYKILYKSSYTSVTIRYKLARFFTKKLFAHSIILQRKVCRISGRAHFVLQRAGLARLPFKFLSGSGLLAGVARYGN
jgi:ribosomal protein S14